MGKYTWGDDMVTMNQEYVFNSHIKKTIAHNIRKYRKQKGFTQEQLANGCDRAFEFIRRIESEEGRRGFSIETLYRISVVLGVRIDHFFEEGEE